MEDTDVRKCKVCNVLKKRTHVGKFDKRNKKFHDENGLTWNGSVCGSCHKLRSRENMRKNRFLKKKAGEEGLA